MKKYLILIIIFLLPVFGYSTIRMRTIQQIKDKLCDLRADEKRLKELDPYMFDGYPGNLKKDDPDEFEKNMDILQKRLEHAKAYNVDIDFENALTWVLGEWN